MDAASRLAAAQAKAAELTQQLTAVHAAAEAALVKIAADARAAAEVAEQAHAVRVASWQQAVAAAHQRNHEARILRLRTPPSSPPKRMRTDAAVAELLGL